MIGGGGQKTEITVTWLTSPCPTQLSPIDGHHEPRSMC